MKEKHDKKVLIHGKSVPVDDVVKYMTSLAVINKYMRHAMIADETLKGGESSDGIIRYD